VAFIDAERSARVPGTSDNTYDFVLGYWDYLNLPKRLVRMDAFGKNKIVVSPISASTQEISWLPGGSSIALRISDRRSGNVVGIEAPSNWWWRTDVKKYMSGKLQQPLSDFVRSIWPETAGFEPTDSDALSVPYELVTSPLKDQLPTIIFFSFPSDAPTVELHPDPRASLQIIRLDGEPSFLTAAYFDAAWSPDGKHVAYSRPSMGRKSILYIAEVDGEGFSSQDARSVTNGLFDARAPAWSPDGSQIVLVSGDGSGLWILNADGSHLVQLKSPSNRFCSHPSWSSDGKWIAADCLGAGFVSGLFGFMPDAASDIYIFNAAKPGLPPRRLTKCIPDNPRGVLPTCGAHNPSFAPSALSPKSRR
jgi:hypothetical protein